MGFARCVEALFQAAYRKLLPPSQIWNDGDDDDYGDYEDDGDDDDGDDKTDFKTCEMPPYKYESGRLSTPS